MGIIIGPALAQANSLEGALRQLQPVSGISICNVSRWVIAAPKRVATVLDEVHIMPEVGQAHDILQVMPDEAAQRPAHNIAQHDNTQTTSHFRMSPGWASSVCKCFTHQCSTHRFTNELSKHLA